MEFAISRKQLEKKRAQEAAAQQAQAMAAAGMPSQGMAGPELGDGSGNAFFNSGAAPQQYAQPMPQQPGMPPQQYAQPMAPQPGMPAQQYAQPMPQQPGMAPQTVDPLAGFGQGVDQAPVAAPAAQPRWRRRSAEEVLEEQRAHPAVALVRRYVGFVLFLVAAGLLIAFVPSARHAPSGMAPQVVITASAPAGMTSPPGT